MKLIKVATPACPCPSKLWAFLNEQTCTEAGCPEAWGVGTIVECDCGSQYTLAESQRDGRYWVKRLLRDKITMTTLRD